MSKQVSPFAELTGAQRQIRWLEYQSIQLPYVETGPEEESERRNETEEKKIPSKETKTKAILVGRPQPPPEIPRTFSREQQKPHHSQYDAVIARLKQAEMQARNYSHLK